MARTTLQARWTGLSGIRCARSTPTRSSRANRRRVRWASRSSRMRFPSGGRAVGGGGRGRGRDAVVHRSEHGPLGLEMLAGRNAPDALKSLLDGDDGRDAAGGDDRRHRAFASHTGVKCIPSAGNLVGNNCSVQANLMDNDTIWPAMAKSVRIRGRGPRRADAPALEAAQTAGGDIRGMQSAAIVVASPGRPALDQISTCASRTTRTPYELRRLVRLRGPPIELTTDTSSGRARTSPAPAGRLRGVDSDRRRRHRRRRAGVLDRDRVGEQRSDRRR